MTCDIDFCLNPATSTLTVDIENSESLQLYFCKDCASFINKEMSASLGDKTGLLDLYKGNIPYNIGDLQKAMAKLDMNL